MNPRSIKISVRLNSSEHDHLKKQSQLSGLSMESLVRSLIMGIDVKPIPPDQLSEIRRQLSAIENNINQIARVDKTEQRLYEAALNLPTRRLPFEK